MALLKIAAIKPQLATDDQSGDIATSVSKNIDLIKSQINLKNNEYINIKNAVKILETCSNWNGYIKLYTEVESNFRIGDIVYITYTEPTIDIDTFNLENPSIPFANYYLGYNVLYSNHLNNEVVIDRYYNDLTGTTYKYLKNQFLSKISCRGGNYYDDISDGVIFYDCNIIDANLAPLSGVVYGSTIPGAIIRCAGLYTISDSNGEYLLNVPVGNIVINAKASGYISKTLITSIEPNIINSFDINLIIGANSISISTPNLIVCQDVNVTFTAICVGYDNPTAIYQWKINNVNVGTDKPTFTTNLLKNGDIVTCLVSDDLDSNLSNSIIMTVLPTKTISISILGNPNTKIGEYTYFSSGDTKTFTASLVNSCSSDIYQWYKNGVLVYTGTYPTFNYIYSPSNYDKIYCKVVSNCQCKNVDYSISNTLTLKARTVSIESNLNNICSGVGVSFECNTTGFISPIYDWKINGDSTSISTSTFYSNSLLNGDVVRCDVTDYGDVITESNGIIMIVTQTRIPYIHITGDTYSIGDAPTPPAPIIMENNFYVNQGDNCYFYIDSGVTCSAKTYKWYKDTSLISTNSAVTLVASSEFSLKCEITTTCPCIVPSIGNSNTFNIKFKSIQLWSNVTILYPGSVIFNWSATGYTNPTYILKQNNVQVYSGTNTTCTLFFSSGTYDMILYIGSDNSNTVHIVCSSDYIPD